MKISSWFTLSAIAMFATSACRERPKQTRAEISADRQFALTNESASVVLGLNAFDVCSLENVRSVSDNSSNPGDAANSWDVVKGQSYEVTGFVVDKARGKVPPTVRLLLVGKKVYALTAKIEVDRPDVAQYFARQDFLRSGYSTIVGFDDVDPGEYQLLVNENEGGSALVCRTFQAITIH
jgi:hypothetical protein